MVFLCILSGYRRFFMNAGKRRVRSLCFLLCAVLIAGLLSVTPRRVYASSGPQYLFIGDSYGVHANARYHWPELYAQRIGLTSGEYGKDCRGGSCFSAYYSNNELKVNNFGSQLNSFSASTALKTILVAGGYNDRLFTSSEVLEGMRFFKLIAHDKFPNARVYVAFIGWTTDETEQAKLLDTLELYRTGCSELGFTFLEGPEKALAGSGNLLGTDGVHPTDEGQKAITDAVFLAMRENEASFKDVPFEAFYHDPVYWALRTSVASGVSDGSFQPSKEVTRAQIITFLWNYFGRPPVSEEPRFSDVSQSSYYCQAVNWAVEQKITSGTGGGKFSPDQPCTRAQCMVFLYKALGEVQSAEPTPTATPTPEVTGTPEATATPTPEVTGTPEATATPTPEVTSTPEATATPTPEVTGTPEVTATPTPEVTGTPEATATPTSEVTSIPEATETPTTEATSTPEATATPTPEVTSAPETTSPAPQTTEAADAASSVTEAAVSETTEALTGSGATFTDVPVTKYYFSAVEWAVKNGISSGTSVSANTFDPDEYCTRAQAVTFLYKAAQLHDSQAVQ